MKAPTPGRSLSACALLLTLAACAGATANAPASPDKAAGAAEGLDAAAYFPLALGNEWTYQARAGGKTSRDTIRTVGRDGAWFLDDHRGRVRAEPDGIRDRERYLLRSPLVAGKSWTATDNMVVQRFEVVATDAKVTVPAGVFEKVVVVKNDQALPNGGRFVTEWSYAPGVGLISMQTSTLAGGKRQEQMSVQLVAFKHP